MSQFHMHQISCASINAIEELLGGGRVLWLCLQKLLNNQFLGIVIHMKESARCLTRSCTSGTVLRQLTFLLVHCWIHAQEDLICWTGLTGGLRIKSDCPYFSSPPAALDLQSVTLHLASTASNSNWEATTFNCDDNF